MVAIELQRRGIDHLLIDQRPEPEYYCKALGITPRTLEVWDQIVVLEEALRYGFFTAGFKGALNRQETDTQDVPVGTMPYGFFMLAQYDTERVLSTHLRRHGGCIARGVQLIELAEAADGMRAHVTDSSGSESTVDCRYVVGCDGAHSGVRKSAGIEYEGDAYPMTFMLGDVR